MALFRNVVFVAAIAGLLSGIFLTVMQSAVTVPLILHAETFEGGGEGDGGGHDHGAEAAPAGTAPATADAAAAHSHVEEEVEAWMPADGFERSFYTGFANVVAGIGFALLLVSVSEALGGLNGWRGGLKWGLAGFLVFSLVPGLGLAPELPGMPAAELGPRQAWWAITAACTAIALGLLVFSRSPLLVVLALALLVAPHLYGAPLPESHDSSVPHDLHARFVNAVFATSLLFWAALGAISGLIRDRFRAGEDELPALPGGAISK